MKDIEARYDELIEKGVENLSDEEGEELTAIQKIRLKQGKYIQHKDEEVRE